jgi:hypothetical protein
MVRLALEKAPAGSRVHAVAEQGIPARVIAEAIGRQLDVLAVSIAPEEAAAHFGWIGAFFGLDMQGSSEQTRELLGWTPSHPGLLDDLAAGHYFRATSNSAQVPESSSVRGAAGTSGDVLGWPDRRARGRTRLTSRELPLLRATRKAREVAPAPEGSQGARSEPGGREPGCPD